MTIEQAKSELMQIYGALSSNKQIAIDTLVKASVKPQEPKTGHWIDDKCSVCGKGTEDLISSSEWYRNEEPNFCPFCGVKLVEPQKSEKE